MAMKRIKSTAKQRTVALSKHKMNDMYSARDMPTASERKKSLLEYAKTMNIKSDFLDSIVDKIVLETPEYSYTGYYASNYGGERYKLRVIFSLNEIKNKTFS